MTVAEADLAKALTAINDKLSDLGEAAIEATEAGLASVDAKVANAQLEANADLLNARNNDADGQAAVTAAKTNATEIKALLVELELAATTKLSDAVLDQVLAKAQKNIDDAKELYSADGTLVAEADGDADGTNIKLYTKDGAYTNDNAGAELAGYSVALAKADGSTEGAAVGNDNAVTFKISQDFNGIIVITDKTTGGDVAHILSVKDGVISVPTDLSDMKQGNDAAVASIVQGTADASGDTTVTITPTSGKNLNDFTIKEAQLIDTVTFADLQAAIVTAENALEAHKSALGDDEAILTQLKGLLDGYATIANAGETVSNIAGSGTVAALVANIDAALAPVSKTYTETAREAAIKAIVDAIKPATGQESTISDMDTSVTPNVDKAASVNAFLAEIEKLDTLSKAITTAETNFAAAKLSDGSTKTGDIYNKVKAAVDERADMVKDAADADAAIDGIQDLVDALQNAMTALDNAKTELGYDVKSLESTSTMAGTDKADLVVIDALKFVGDDATLTAKDFTVNALAEGDAVLLNGWTYNEGALTAGDNGVLEFFVKTEGGKTTITYETEVYGSASTDVHTITLNGVTDVSVEDGVILIG